MQENPPNEGQWWLFAPEEGSYFSIPSSSSSGTRFTQRRKMTMLRNNQQASENLKNYWINKFQQWDLLWEPRKKKILDSSSRVLCSRGGIFSCLYLHHEKVPRGPNEHILEGYPTEKANEAEDAPYILWVLYIPKWEFRNPRDVLPESNAIVSAWLTKKLINPGRRYNHF